MANSVLVQKRALCYVKEETTYGQDISPAAADAIIVENFEPPNVEVEARDNPAITASTAARRAPSIASYWQTVSFDVPLKHSHVGVTTQPKCGRLLVNASMEENLVTDTTYTPSSTYKLGCTYHFYADGKLHEILGGIAKVTAIRITHSDVLMMSIEVSGLYSAVSDVAIPGSPVFDTTQPIPCRGGTLTIGGFAAVFRSVEFAQNAEVAKRGSIGAATGVAGFIHTGRAWGGTIVVEDDLVANRPWVANLVAGATKALSVAVGTTPNKVTIACPAIVKISVEHGSDEGVRTLSIGFQAIESAAGLNDEIDITLS